MRKGNVKILLLMLFVLAGLAFVFLLTLKSSDLANRTAQAAKQDQEDVNSILTQMQENEETMDTENYSRELEDFRRMVTNLEQTNTEMFQTQTRESFMELADLIDGLREKKTQESALNETMVQEEPTNAIRENARDVAAADNPQKLVIALQNSFNASRDAIRGVLSDYRAMDSQMNIKKYEDRLNEIRTKTNEISQENHKMRTKELFLNFHSILKQMYMEKNRIDGKTDRGMTQQ